MKSQNIQAPIERAIKTEKRYSRPGNPYYYASCGTHHTRIWEDSSLSDEQNHVQARIKMCEIMEWDMTDWVIGRIGNTQYHVRRTA